VGYVALAATRLAHLSIEGEVSITDEHVQVLAGSLTALTYLDLSSSYSHLHRCGITDLGAAAISQLTQMCSLSLDNNVIGDRGACALSPGSPHVSRLKEPGWR
jgi:hypothetical protein